MGDDEPHFDSEEVRNEGEVRILRVALKSESDAIKWVSVFAETTRTEWVKLRTYPDPRRYVFRCQWGCAFSSKNKRAPTKRNLACPAKMNMLIKLNTSGTRKKDPYLRGENPKAAEITITGSHNHDLECADTSKMMRGKSNLRESFYQYFQRGMSPAQAMKFHEQKIMVEERGTELLNDAHFNPTKRTVYHWHCLWRKLNRPSDEKRTETLGSFWENFMSSLEMQHSVFTYQPADAADAGTGPEPCNPASDSEPTVNPTGMPTNGMEKSKPPDSSHTQDAALREKANALFAEIVEKSLSLHQMEPCSTAYVKHLETINDRLSSLKDGKAVVNMLARIASAMRTKNPRSRKIRKPLSDKEEERKRRRKPLESDSEE